MDFSRQFGIDEEKENKGTKINTGKNADGSVSYLIIARLRNKQHKAAVDSLSESEREILSFYEYTDPEMGEVFNKLYNGPILKGWGGYTENDKPLAYSKKTAYAMIMKHKEFRRRLAEEAQKMENFKLDFEEKELKNSEE